MTFGTSDRTTRREPPPRRSRIRFLLPLAVLLWAAVEIWLMVVVADRIGGGLVLLLLLAGVVLGGVAVKRAGRRAWNNLSAMLRTAAPPGADGTPGGPAEPAAVPTAGGTGTAMLGGLLLMIPGFVSDAAGLLCLFPPTRKLLGAAAGRLGRRGPLGGYGDVGGAFEQARMRMPDGKVVRGEVVRDDSGAGPDGRRDGDQGHRPPGDGPRPPLTP
ncbi:FxsA family protein [Streptomyces sp. SL13]|uniref:FxsA family protein n=1 Tax=Streptantibioticus silvisoli TaxID=2705255 RepID=A0AA90HBS5_9ACTN|nr:FxsA family membrane protein [Streptantibioticus silvisoli]MDI5966104.1 FxsA family protein [Streptantibioticus silvisoli]MDI5971932.1 FxsA family protein [Streptantibioticus silvisoli]